MSEHEDKAPLEAPQHWSSLDELARSPEFEAWAASEFPSAWESAQGTESGRRSFLKRMGASLGLAGLGTACVRQPEEVILPYIKQPEELVPGKPVEFASAVQRAGYGVGVLVETHMYRPTHLRGNPEHPDSLGGLHPQEQSTVLSVWDPERSRQLVRRGNVSTWDSFVSEMKAIASALVANNGYGLAILSGASSSPTLQRTLERVQQDLPEATFHTWEPVSRANMYEGARQAFGQPLEVHYRLDRAQVIFDLDADFMGNMPGATRHQAQVLRPRNEQEFEAWSRLYVAEPTPTVGGATADHRIRIRPSDAGALLAALAEKLGVSVSAPRGAVDSDFVEALAKDLIKAGRRGVVIVGDHLPPEFHQMAHAIHAKLGSAGHVVVTTKPVLNGPYDPMESMRSLVDFMKEGRVQVLVMLDQNPIYNAPRDLGFEEAFQEVDLRIHVGPHDDETARLSHWHIPSHHYLETWNDVRATDGTASIMQPSLKPLHDTKSVYDVLDLFASGKARTDHDRVQETWKGLLSSDGFEKKWRRALHDGVVAGSAFEPVALPNRGPPKSLPEFEVDKAQLELRFVADPHIYDGRFATNAWLMELPQPMTKLTWDNAVLLSPNTAKELSVESGQVLVIEAEGRSVRGPAWVLPGQADGVATVHFGWGRTQAGSVGTGHGFNVYPLRSSDSPYVRGAKLQPTKDKEALACTQDHFRVMDRGLIRWATPAEYEHNPKFVHAREAHFPQLSLWKPWAYTGNKWGMTINLSSCNGCNACVVACQSENNIATVGKEEVLKGREMHWIRVDRYFAGDPEDPIITPQPMTCQMCENAPCETVCPVNATVHGPEGLNQMVYNRCVGTRYCSNNCPYKVRRFNFFLYSEWYEESAKGQRNPDVTVRSRGVMEKCTYCVQRINRARIAAKVHGDGTIPTDSVKTACQEACPSQAIQFGDLNDPKATVTQMQQSPLSYTVLSELNTKPRTTYLARLVNVAPDSRTKIPSTAQLVEKAKKESKHEHH